ncbi:MAG: hypothetical protein ABJA81_06770, partial [Nocardioidaceae bacterium]
DYAPVMMVNWEFFDNQTPESAVQIVDELRSGAEVAATRGARVCSWREAERVLAGFPDDRADEGPAAGPATLVGLKLARDNNWRAPASNGGRPPETKGDSVAAVEPADTSRAESETKVDASKSDTAGGAQASTDAQGSLFDDSTDKTDGSQS